MSVGAIIQARTSSSRLPGKVLKELPYNSGTTVLQQVIRRVLKASLVDEVIVATTTGPEDDEISKIAGKEEVKGFRGSKEDVLSRYFHAARENDIDIIVRITGDCPCIDWKIIDSVVRKVTEEKNDFASVRESYPRGIGDLEVFTFKALETAFLQARDAHEREHVCPYIYSTNPEAFKIAYIEATGDLYCPEIRLTLDTAEDYAVLCEVYDDLYNESSFFTTTDIVDLFRKKPWLKIINSKVVQKTLNNLDGEIAEALKLLEIQDLKKAKDFLEKQWKS